MGEVAVRRALVGIDRGSVDMLSGRKRRGDDQLGRFARAEDSVAAHDPRGSGTEIEIEVSASCESCDGSGAQPGTGVKTCGTCGGHGQVRAQQGFFVVERTCPGCHGAGQVIESPCPTCRGGKVVLNRVKVEANVPPGVDNGTILHMPGQGDDGINGGRPGDLYVAVKVAADPRFTRDKHGLITNIAITFPKAAMGATLTLDGIDSGFQLSIPAGTQSGQEFRVRGQGVPPIGGGERGDLRVRVQVDVPRELSEYQKQLLDSFEKSLEGDQKATGEGPGFLGDFLKSVKK